MEINWIERSDKNEMYKLAMDYCQEHCMTKENSSVLTLLLPPGNFSDAEEVKNYLYSFFQEIDAPAVLSIEPVLPGNTLSTMRLLKIYGKCRTELLPFYHAHILVKDESLNSTVLRNKWNEIVGSKIQKLFRCSPVEKSIREVINYITKFFEVKRGGKGQIGFIVQGGKFTSEVIEKPDKTALGVLQRVKTVFKNLIGYYFQIPNVILYKLDETFSTHEKVGRGP